MNYKDTLNLPRTDFSMKANLLSLEPKIISHWQNIDIYRTLRKERQGLEKFILHDGPPYANGLIHIGHALNKILKDIVIKYKVLAGYDCPFIIGWDCHGLPVEHQLFKELSLTKHDVEVSIFRKKAKEYALKFVKLQAEDFKRLGIFCDWDNPYLTLDPNYEYNVLGLLEYLIGQGYVYRGRRPVNWCATCETALAEAEVEYYDKESHSIYVLFKTIEDKGIFDGKEVYFLVWTTTPWTLVSNVAVAIQPNLTYVLADFAGKLLVLAKDLLPSLQEKFNSASRVLKTFQGLDLEHLKLAHPFLERKVPVVLADFVSKDDGSGCVHIAPGHGEEDFSLVRKYQLEVIMPVNEKGIFDEQPDFRGKNIEGANALVLEKLTQSKSIVNHEKVTHSYPHCWRCKAAIIFRATFQWFLDVNQHNLRSRLVKEIEKVTWVPAAGKERMKGMLEIRPDWCLSRQRLWGVPIPAVKCENCGEVVLSAEVTRKTAEVFRKEGSDSWFTQDIKKFIPSEFTCSKCKQKKFQKEFDILDVWFESGASFLAVVKANPELVFPADLYLEGSDQHRGWFQVSLIPSVAKESRAPFKTILTHGFVVDGEGRKMSKSLGNVIAPQEIHKQYGAEVLRLWAAYSDYSEDVKISEGIVKQLVDIYRKIRNTIRFILGNLADFNPEKNALPFTELAEIDRFMLAKSMLLYKEVISSYDNFSFYKVCQSIFNFCNLDLSSFYLDILKDRLYTFSQNSKARRSAQFVLFRILRIILKSIAPILAFTAEEAYLSWEIFRKKDSIFATRLDDEYHQEWQDRELIQRWEKILSLRSAVLKEIEKKREEGLIGSSLEAAIFLTAKAEDCAFYRNYQEVLREVFIVSEVTIQEGNFGIIVDKVKGKKCLRCWNWSKTVGMNTQHPDVCSKCVAALKEERS